MLLIALLLSCLLAVEAFNLMLLKNYPKALCNDGSPAGYYYKPPVNASSTYLIYLQGGDWCYNQVTCDNRINTYGINYTSSTQWASTLTVNNGLLAFPPVDAHIFRVNYCSSDAYVGNTVAFNKTFAGLNIIHAIVNETIYSYGLGQTKGNTLIFAGGSAGARGALVHLDRVPFMLSNFGAKYKVSLLGFFDSPNQYMVPSYNYNQFIGIANQTMLLYRNLNASASITNKCTKMHSNPSSLWKCMFGEYILPMLDNPFLLVQSRFDSNNLLKYNFFNALPFNQTELEYADLVANYTLSFLSGLALLPNSGIISSSCLTHDISSSKTTYLSEVIGSNTQLNTTGESIKNVFSQIVTSLSKNSNPVKLFDSCNQLNCGIEC